MHDQRSMPLREQAMEALQQSTTMLQVARNLLEQGNREEAQRLQNEARIKRHDSVLLMARANELEKDSGGKGLSRFHEVNSSKSH